MHLTAAKQRQRLEGTTAIGIAHAEHRQGYEHLVGMQAHIAALQIFELHLLYRLNHGLRDEVDLVIDACQMLGDIKQQGS